MKRILLLIIFISMGALYAQEKSTTHETNESVGFKLESVNKGVVEVKEITDGLRFDTAEDKVMALVFIAYNGKPCLRLIEILNELKKEHSDFNAFAVEMRELEGKKLQDYAKEHKIDFPIMGAKKAEKFVHYIREKAGWGGSMPFILLLNKKGEVKYLQIGLIPKKGFEKAYQQLKK